MKKIKINWITKLAIPLLCLGMIGVTLCMILSYREIDRRSSKIAIKQLYDTTQTLQLTIEKELQTYVYSLNTLKSMLEGKPHINDHDKDVILNGLEAILEQHPTLFGAWAIIEPEVIADLHSHENTLFHDEVGRFAPYLEDMKGELSAQTMISHLKEAPVSDFYTIPLKTGDIYVTPVMNYQYKRKLVRVISIGLPFSVGGEVNGVIGVDLEITRLTDYIASYPTYDRGYAVLYDRNRTVIAHPNRQLLGTSPYDDQKMTPLERAAMDHTMETYEFSTVKANAEGDGELVYKTFVPVFIHPEVEPYIVQVVVPFVEIFAPIIRLKFSIIGLGTTLIVLLSFIIQRFVIYHVRRIDDEMSWYKYLSNK